MVGVEEVIQIRISEMCMGNKSETVLECAALGFIVGSLKDRYN